MKEEFSKYVNELEEKAKKYEFWKEKNESVISNLSKISELILEIRGQIEPKINIGIAGRRKSDKQGIIDELYEKMQSGTQITSSLIEKTYNLGTQNGGNYILTKLSQMPKVQKAKDGIFVRLFI